MSRVPDKESGALSMRVRDYRRCDRKSNAFPASKHRSYVTPAFTRSPEKTPFSRPDQLAHVQACIELAGVQELLTER